MSEPSADGSPVKTLLGTEDPFGIGRPIGEILRDFHLVDKLGEGAVGIVYKAHQLSLDQDVALKILAPQYTDSPQFVSRFYREARMSVQLKGNVHIIHGVAVGFACAVCGYNGPPEEHAPHAGADRERGVHYFAMEFVEGHDLSYWLTQRGHLPVGDAVKITIDVARALEYAHSRKRPIFHRDVKPANIMVTPDGDVKLADLGLAKVAEEGDGPTQFGEMAGTPAYMPPEQARNAGMIDGRSDIYALGATLYVLLTGKKPFPGKTSMDILAAKDRGTFEPAHSVNPEVPGALDRLLSKMLAVDVGRRYQTAGEAAAALVATGLAATQLSIVDRDATVAEAAETPAPWAHPQRPRWAMWAVGGILASSVVAGVFYLVAARHVVQRPGPVSAEAPSTGDAVDTVVARAMEQVATNETDAARSTLKRWLSEHPADERVDRPLRELERGSLVLFQHQTPVLTSPVGPIWAADGIALTERDNYRFGVALARQCYLYVYQCDTRPNVTLIFPNSHYSPLSNPLAAGALLWLPSDPKHPKASWLHLDTPPGAGRAYFIAVTAPLNDLAGLGNQLLASTHSNPDERGLSALLQAHTPDGKPAEPCFVSNPAVQVFRFERTGEKPAPAGQVSIG